MTKKIKDKKTNTKTNTNTAILSVSFGVNELGLELLKKIENYNNLVATGSKDLEDNVPEILKNVCCNPKNETIINTVLKNNPTDSEVLKLKESRDKEIIDLPITKELMKIKDMIPAGYTLKAKEIRMKDNGKLIKRTYLPYSIRGLYNPSIIDNTNIPTSITAFSFVDKGIIETKEHIYEINVASVAYSQYTNKYEIYKWNVLYTLIKSTIDKTTEAEKTIDNVISNFF